MVIGPDGIKMKEEKVKGVLDWPTPERGLEVFGTSQLLPVVH